MKHILIVDDNKTNLTMAKNELASDYSVTAVLSGMQALQFLSRMKTDLILLDINMPEMDGKETMRRIRANAEWKKIPIIFLTADSSPETEAECLLEGADDFIAKPFVPQVMRSRIARIMELNELRNDLETKLEEKTKQLEIITLNSIMAIAKTIEAKDTYTSGHSERVATCAEAIAQNLGWDEESIQKLKFEALLHDIGKIGVPDNILNKPEALSDEEFNILKIHTSLGGEILGSIRTMPDLHEGALYHHEKFDGTGYPTGLSGEAIPIEARIIAIADTYDAMAFNRKYRAKLSEDAIIAEFSRVRGTQFDPSLVDVFLEMLQNGFTLEEQI